MEIKKVAAASLPESQPSPSEDCKQEALSLVLDLEGWSTNEKVEIVIKRLRSHDAKVSGQAEKRLKKIKSIVEDPARKVEYGTPEYYLLQRLSVALQESPSD